MKTGIAFKRCQLSKEWIVYPRYIYTQSRLGYIVGESKDGTCWRVLWDGLNCAGTLLKRFIDIVE